MTRPYEFRDPDGNLRLDELLGERYVKHYTRILESSDEGFRAMQLSMAVAASAPDEPETAWYAWQEPRSGETIIDGLVLVREGDGPEACSSSQALGTSPAFIWDVCGYYRRLGFDWSEFAQVTPKKLRMRYLALDPRQEDGDLFYALDQLLDPVIRYAYDRMPLGGLFMGDRDVREHIERQAAVEATKRNLAAYQAGEDVTDQGEVLSEWGFEKGGLSDEEARERLRAQADAPLGSADSALGATLNRWDRHWSYYRLAGRYEDSWDTSGPSSAALETWQAMLGAVLSERGVTVQFSVGWWDGEGPKMWRDSNKTCIFFLGAREPTQGLARQAVEGY